MHKPLIASTDTRLRGGLAASARWRLALPLAILTLAGWLALAASLREGGYLRNAYRELRRELAEFQILMNLESVSCPTSAVVLLTVGQSNAANHVGSRVPRDAALPAFASFRGRCVMIEDPVPGASGSDGSMWTMLAQRLSRELQVPVVIIAGATSGASVRDWRDNVGGLRSRLVRSIDAAIATGLRPNVVIWLQGEADAARKTPADMYASQLRETLAVLRQAMTRPSAAADYPSAPAAWPPAIVTLTSTCYNTSGGRADVRAGQVAVAMDDGANVRLGPDTDGLGDEFRRDACHFNDAGRERIVTELLAHLKVGLSGSARP